MKAPDRASLLAEFRRIRALSETLCTPLAADDWRMQTMPDVSPPWWNLGHTSWFFARNVLHELAEASADLAAFSGFDYALNSYYYGLGERLPRARRGSVARPATDEILRYRAAVDAATTRLLSECDATTWPRVAEATTIGLHHEQQHQELFLSEIQHIRWSAPAALRQAYVVAPRRERADAPSRTQPRFVSIAGGIVEIGASPEHFAWDNERPRHRAFVEDFELCDRLVTCGEWLAFMAAGGYREPLLWLSNGWDRVVERGWRAPLYWEEHDGVWHTWTLHGLLPVDPAAPVCHVGFYEAEAFARWAGARLPTEREWEHATRVAGFDTTGGHLLGARPLEQELRPRPSRAAANIDQLAGDVWEWTTSHYEPYPGYRPFDGALMEYNGKFMDNQRVLRGGSFATPRDHVRASYRNFWPADTRFQFTGLRLAR